MRSKKFQLIIIVLAIIIITLPDFVLASAESGTIDPGFRYAWSNNIGTVSFYTDAGNVAVTDSGLSGYAWNSGYGWINLNPPNGGVTNDGEGNLSGYAWGQNLGWINFSGVRVNSAGKFTGSASGDIIGTLTFDCNKCAVKTDWRSVSSRSGGSSLPAGSSLPPSSPSLSGGLKVVINKGDKETASRNVILTFSASSDIAKIAISNTSDFISANQENYSAEKNWTLSEGEGVKTVYVKFYTKWGVPSEIISNSVIFKRAIEEEANKEEAKTEAVDQPILKSLFGLDGNSVNFISLGEAEIIIGQQETLLLNKANEELYKKIIANQSSGLSEAIARSLSYFIQAGSLTTQRLGEGERAGSLNSFISAFNKLPSSIADWQDVIKISNGRWPSQRNKIAEDRAAVKFKKIYLRSADMGNSNDNAAVTIMAYGLRPANRNLDSEKAAIKSFKYIYNFTPVSAQDWDIVRAIAYSGAKR